jgi:hypothetical protein
MPVHSFVVRRNTFQFVSSFIGLAIAFGGAVLCASSASASPVVQFDILVTGGSGGPFGTSFLQNGAPTPNSDVFNYQHTNPWGGGNVGPLNGPLGEWVISSWDFNADGDPAGTGGSTGAKINTGFIIKNLRPDGADPLGANPNQNRLQFSIMVTMPVMPSVGPTQFFGSGAMLLTIDESPNNYAGILSAPNGPIFNYMINGVDVASLFPAGFQMGGTNGPTTAGTSGNLTATQTGPLTGIHPTTMGIRLDFELTPGEQVSFTGVFGFIPGPGGLALLAVAALRQSRRRR